MKIKTKYAFFFFVFLILLVVVLTVGIIFGKKFSNSDQTNTLIKFADTQRNVSSTPVLISATPTFPPATPTSIEYTIGIINIPSEIIEGGIVTFTWNINGVKTTINTTSVYYGTTSSPGKLSKDIPPEKTKYTDSIKDFMTGEYVIPLTFIGNTTISKAGTYYARVYAKIDERNYWSDEKTFVIKPIPRHEIRFINYPEKVKLNDNSTFTWEITGPKATTGYTVVVGAKESKSGTLDDTTDLSKTPYRVLVNDFTNGTYNIPLTYVGTTVMPEYGKYYVRVLTLINGKNIWSDEHTVSVE